MEQTDKRKESTPATPAKKQKTGEPPERECMEDVQFVLDNDYVPLSNKPLNAKMKTEDTWGKTFCEDVVTTQCRLLMKFFPKIFFVSFASSQTKKDTKKFPAVRFPIPASRGIPNSRKMI